MTEGNCSSGASEPSDSVSFGEIAAIALGNTVGASVGAAQILYVAAIIRAGALTPVEVGWIASAELLANALSALIGAAWFQGRSPRMMAVGAALVVAASNGVAMAPSMSIFVVARIVSGAAMGTLLAACVGVAARKQHSQRTFATMQIISVCLNSAYFFLSTWLVDRLGLRGIFAYIIVLAIASALVSANHLSIAGWNATPSATTAAATAKRAPFLACLAMATVAMGMTSVATFFAVIGNDLGLNNRVMSVLLGATLPLGLIGSFSARLLSDRFGLIRPLLCALLLIASVYPFLVRASSPIAFSTCLSVLDMAAFFYIPYAYALISHFDPSGRFASASSAFIMLGGAVGPALGAHLISLSHLSILATSASSLVVAGLLMMTIAGKQGGVLRLGMSVKPNA
jgi:predicted MFS family arabinose efflux permease